MRPTLAPRRRDGVLLALASALFAASFSALAQPKPALTQNTNEPGLNPYIESKQVEQDAASCEPGTPPFAQCTIEMLPVPVGKRLVVTYVAASYFLSTGAIFPAAFLAANSSGFVLLPLLPVQAGTADARQSISAPITFYVEPGEAPRFILRGFDIVAARTASLSLVGYYVNLP
jgi:hypothetical protein